MRLPVGSAAQGIYQSPNPYVVVFDVGLSVHLVPMGYSCNSSSLPNCESGAKSAHNSCRSTCDILCSYPNICGHCYWDCDYQFEVALNQCRSLYGCPAGYVCQEDLKRHGSSYCCPLDQLPCDGMCRSPICPPRQSISPVTCNCQCPPLICLPHQVPDFNECKCKCSNVCPLGFLQDEASCRCYCPQGKTECNGRCVVLEVDRENCGRCGNACKPDKEDCCHGVCSRLDRDPHCGACGTDCHLINRTCCTPSGSSWGRCTKLDTDNDNCGSCLNRCLGGRVCSLGTCVCPTNRPECGAVCCNQGEGCCGGHCTRLDIDPNCGACGHGCGNNERCCNRTCTRIDTVTHCGDCTTTCRSGGLEACAYNSSRQRYECICVPPYTRCPDGWCRDLSTDPQNCGRCGIVCPTGRICRGGACVCPSGQPPCGPNCCTSDQVCSGQTCMTPTPCNNTIVAGGDTMDIRVIQMGRPSGTFNLSWQMVNIPDRLEVWYEGHQLFSTGCVSFSGQTYITYAGTATTITVVVWPNCSGSTQSTEWRYLIGCP